jgi:ribosomal protein S18 acetylase RimI-like enzyme
MNITVKRLSPELKKDFLYFFDEVAFTDNEKWSRCYCQCYLEAAGEEWIQRSGETNRNAAIQRIDNGTMSGFIAFEENDPVGWCHVGLKKNIKAYSGEPDGDTAVIVCFIISPNHRRKGIATTLLNHILHTFKTEGVQYIEAYPSKNLEKVNINYHGFFNMYQNAGFDIVNEEDDCYVVRKQLL